MGKWLTFACCLGLVLFAGYEILHWLTTGALDAFSKGGVRSNALTFEHEPGQFILTLIFRVGSLLLGCWGMIYTLRDGDPPE